jgi:hypothetical protein
MFIRPFSVLVFLCTFCFPFIAHNTYTADNTNSPFDVLVDDVFSRVLIYAYAHYEDLTFRDLAFVSKKWHTVISKQNFLPACKENGWKEPVVVVCKINPYFVEHCLEHGLKLPNDYNEKIDGRNPYDLSGYPTTFFDDAHPNHPLYNTIFFEYFRPDIGLLKSTYKHPAVFLTGAEKPAPSKPFSEGHSYLGIWVHPGRTYIHNKILIAKDDHKRYEESKMIFSAYIQNKDIEKSYRMYAEHIVFRTPIPASRIIKKVPQQYQRASAIIYPSISPAYMMAGGGAGLLGMAMASSLTGSLLMQAPYVSREKCRAWRNNRPHDDTEDPVE